MIKIYFSLILAFFTLSLASQEIKLVDFKSSDCDETVDTYRIRTRIVDQSFIGDTLQIKVGLVATCCVDFVPSLKFENDTLDLLYEETGDACECECCYQFIYSITGLENKTFKAKLQSKNIEISDEKFLTYPIKYFTFDGDTTGFRDKYGFKQGIIITEYDGNLLEEHYKDNIQIKFVLTDKQGNFIKEGIDMFKELFDVDK